jgi:hypothetical protein
MPGVFYVRIFMCGFGAASLVRNSANASGPGVRDVDIYDRHAAGLYRQALLTLDDAGMAEQVVSDVIVDECMRSPASARNEDDVGSRLAVSAYHRCQEVADGPTWQIRAPSRRPSRSFADCIDPDGLSVKERGALGLVIFGGLGYIRASHELAIYPPDMAALLRGLLHRLASSAPNIPH